MGCKEQPLEPTDLVRNLAAEEAATGLVTAGTANSTGSRLDHRAACSLQNEYTLQIDNDFLPLPTRRQWVLEGEEDGEAIRVVITVLNQTENVGGVITRVVEEREFTGPSFNDLELIERSNNFYAQVDAGPHEGTVCYFGEQVFPASIGGSWRADNPNSHAGIFMPADPEVGDTYLQEDAPNARDLAGHIGENRRVTTPSGATFHGAIFVRDCNTIEEPGCDPLAGDGSVKVYGDDFGFVADGPTRLARFRPGNSFPDDDDDD